MASELSLSSQHQHHSLEGDQQQLLSFSVCGDECLLQLLSPPPHTFPFFNTQESTSCHLNEQQDPSPQVEEEDLVATVEINELLNMNQEYCDDDMDPHSHTLSLSIPTPTTTPQLQSYNFPPPKPKPTRAFRKRTSIYRGVTRHRYTGRYEAHLWDGDGDSTTTTHSGQPRKGRQVYLGGYDMEENAARAYDLGALKYWGRTTTTNFPISNYEKELEEMKLMTKLEHVASIRRKSSGFSRGVSIYRGVTRHHQHGRWQARIGRVDRNRDLYLGTFSTQEEAAEAYDVAAIKFRGPKAVTNFEINHYDVKSIMENETLQIRGGVAKCLKDAENTKMAQKVQVTDHEHTNGGGKHGSPAIAFQAQPLSIYPFAHQTAWSKQVQDSDAGDGSNDAHQLQLGSNRYFLHDDHMISVASSPGEQSSDLSSSVGSFIVVPPVMGNDEKALGYEGMYGSTDAYYQSSWDGIGKTSFYNNWIPSGVAAGDNTAAVCHGASSNDTLN